jgi:methionyl-tRNA formyltransferase
MRIVFMGSPDFAVPSLDTLVEQFDVVGVITQPDRPSGRGRRLSQSRVKDRSIELGLSIFQPKRMRDDASIEMLRGWQPDVVVVAAYGQILSQECIDVPTRGSINVHASLLPRWRGAAPVQAAILHGDTVTGVTLMLMDAGLDTGPILAQRMLEVTPVETGGELTHRLAQLGAEMLPDTISSFINNDIAPIPQIDGLVTYAPMLKKVDGQLDFSQGAISLERQIRAYEPWPGSYFQWRDLRIVVRKALATEGGNTRDIGSIITINKSPAVVTSKGILVLEYVQPSGKKTMRGEDFIRGSPSFVDENVLTTEQ